MIEDRRWFPRLSSVACLAFLGQLPPVCVLMAIQTRRTQTEKGPLLHELIVPTDVSRFDVTRSVTRFALCTAMLAVELESHGAMIKRALIKADEVKRSTVMLLVAIDAVLVRQSAMVSCPSIDTCFDFNVTVETFRPHDGLADLMAGGAIRNALKGGMRL
ncbi:MAG: hypothetical protein IH628_14085 [Proteobacteria bacterium]|nr:hypothetical protein [Pseudomonadota bacterium]